MRTSARASGRSKTRSGTTGGSWARCCRSSARAEPRARAARARDRAHAGPALPRRRMAAADVRRGAPRAAQRGRVRDRRAARAAVRPRGLRGLPADDGRGGVGSRGRTSGAASSGARSAGASCGGRCPRAWRFAGRSPGRSGTRSPSWPATPYKEDDQGRGGAGLRGPDPAGGAPAPASIYFGEASSDGGAGGGALRLGVPARIAIATALAACPLASASDLPAAPATRSFEADVKPVLERSCYACHNSALKNADVNLQAFETEADVLKDDHTWVEGRREDAHARHAARRRSRRSRTTRSASSPTGSRPTFERAEAGGPPDPGRVTARRLNRTEYDNSVRDLLGVDLRLAEDFPQDDTGYGFDNNGDVLSLSPALMEKYLVGGRAHRARRGLRPRGRRQPASCACRPRGRAIEPTPDAAPGVRPTGLTPPQRGARDAPLPGRRATYVMRLILGGERPAGSEPLEVGLVPGRPSRSASSASIPRASARSSTTARTSRARRASSALRVTAGEHRLSGTIVRLYEGLPAVLRRPEPVEAAGPAAARVQAAAGRYARGDREAARSASRSGCRRRRRSTTRA